MTSFLRLTGVGRLVCLALFLASFILFTEVRAQEGVRRILEASLGTGQANGDSTAPAMDDAGRVVCFTSAASNLVNDDPNGSGLDVFCWELGVLDLRLVSVPLVGNAGTGGDSFGAVVSADGRWVAFESVAKNLVTNSVTGKGDVYLRDLVGGITLLASQTPGGRGGNGASTAPQFCQSGQVLVFESDASDLVVEDANGATDLFAVVVPDGLPVLVSRNAAGTGSPLLAEEDSLGGSRAGGLSSDGRWVVFQSTATNLVAADTNRFSDVFVHDRLAGVTTLVSAEPGGGVGGGESTGAAISGDGRAVVFQSTATNLVTGFVPSAGGGKGPFVYRRDILNGETRALSTNRASRPVISPDGRWVAFQEGADVLALWEAATGAVTKVGFGADYRRVDGGVFSRDGLKLVYRVATVERDWILMQRDLATGVERQVFPREGARQGRGSDPTLPDVSGDGTRLVLSVGDLEGWPDDANACEDVVLIEMESPSVRRLSFGIDAPGGRAPSGFTGLGKGPLSADGRYLVFSSSASDLVNGDMNGESDVFLLDRATGEVRPVSVRFDGTGHANGASIEPSISADGRRIAFVSTASDLVDPARVSDTNRTSDVFVHDVQAGTTRLASMNRFGTGAADRDSEAPQLSADGRWVVYQSKATDVVAGDGNLKVDVFVYDVESGTNRTLNARVTGMVGSGESTNPTLSPDGRQVVFWSSSSGLTTDALPQRNNVFLHDVQTQRTAALTTNLSNGAGMSSAAGAPGCIARDGSAVLFFWGQSPPSLYYHSTLSATNFLVATNVVSADISADGNYVVFTCRVGSSSVPFVVQGFDVPTRTTQAISAAVFPGETPSGSSSYPVLSPDGRFVVFRSEATNVVSGQVARFQSYFWFDRQLRRTVDLGDAFLPPGSKAFLGRPYVAGGGRAVLFVSNWQGPSTSDANRLPDVLELQLPDVEGGPVLAVTRIPGGGVEVRWGAAAGVRQRVEFTDDPARGVWSELGEPIQSTGDGFWVSDQSAPAARRFYRVVVW